MIASVLPNAFFILWLFPSDHLITVRTDHCTISPWFAKAPPRAFGPLYQSAQGWLEWFGRAQRTSPEDRRFIFQKPGFNRHITVSLSFTPYAKARSRSSGVSFRPRFHSQSSIVCRSAFSSAIAFRGICAFRAETDRLLQYASIVYRIRYCVTPF